MIKLYEFRRQVTETLEDDSVSITTTKTHTGEWPKDCFPLARLDELMELELKSTGDSSKGGREDCSCGRHVLDWIVTSFPFSEQTWIVVYDPIETG